MESLGNGISGLILDAVGTLIEADPPVADAYLAVATRQNVAITRAELRERFVRQFRREEADDRRGTLSTDEAAEHRRWERIVAAVLPELPDPERGFRELWTHFARPQAWRCFPDVAPFLAQLEGTGLAVCIGSNFDRRLRDVAAGLPDLGGLASRLVISSEVGTRKPGPAFFASACDLLGLPAERVLCVGDDLENDVRGAERAGLRGLLLDRKGAHPDVPNRVAGLLELVGPLPAETG